MTLETDQTSPKTYQKLMALSELIIERNNIIKILGGFRRTKTVISKKMTDILTNKFLSKIALIDKQSSRLASGLSCSVCQEKLSITDEVLACEWCGSPGHKAHLIKHVKKEGYCPACGEYLKYYIIGPTKTVTHDLFKTCVYAVSDKIHELQIIYGNKLIEQVSPTEKIQCPECERQISQDWNFCRYCGTRLEHQTKREVQMTVCPRCGGQIKTSWRFCKICGHPLAIPND